MNKEKIMKITGLIYSIISIFALVLMLQYMTKLTDLNIKDVNEGLQPTFPWLFVALIDALPAVIALGNVVMWKYVREKNNKKAIIAIIIPIFYAIIMMIYFLRLIL